jgi:prepilin-type N-terminal cleavage/methylation domain-containing protein
VWEKLIEIEGYNLGEKGGECRGFTPLEIHKIKVLHEFPGPFLTGFTLVEVLVVISILSVLMAILLPVLGKMKHQARTLQGMSNMREIVNAVNYYALDNANYYPDSVATIGVGSHWNWQEPTMLTGYRKRSPQLHRSMSAYLGEYIKDAKTVFCTNAPEKYKHLKKAWEAGDDWDNPDTPPVPDPVIGVYCFYWNYVGYLEEPRGVFRGPFGTFKGPGESELLVSDYFGYGHWRSPDAYGSCERFTKGGVTPGTYVSSAYWSCPGTGGEEDRAGLEIQLHGGYMDGHVESYSPSETVPMKVSISPDGRIPYPDGVGPGTFYVPIKALD